MRAMTLLDLTTARCWPSAFWDSEKDMRSADARLEEVASNLPDIGQRRTGVAVCEIILDEDLS
jgi:hypothetical protein